MARPLRLFLLAGEHSGDGLGADLVRRLRARATVELSGIGGPQLQAEGLRSLFPMSDLSVMGWADVLPRLPLLLWRARQTAQSILASCPDVVVLIDAQVFSASVARQLRAGGWKSPILLYVAPSVWAWGPERAGRLVPLFDEVLSVLPFEPAVMARLGGPPTSFVGHPAAEAYPMRASALNRGPFLLLPGSRRGELRRHLPLMRTLAQALKDHPRVDGFLLPTLPQLEPVVSAEAETWDLPVTVVSGPEAKRDAFSRAVAACAVMGTITLELALAGVPTVGTYVGDRGQVARVRKYSIRHVSLPNLILDEALIPEELFVRPEPQRLAAAVRALLDDPAAAERQLQGFRRIRAQLRDGLDGAPRWDPADRVLSHARAYQREPMGS